MTVNIHVDYKKVFKDSEKIFSTYGSKQVEHLFFITPPFIILMKNIKPVEI